MAKHYRPIGRCIYCGSTDRLGKEHILAFSLGGNLVLPRASCRSCEQKIGPIEQDVARTGYGLLRAAEKVQTRNPARRPDRAIFEGIDHQGNRRQIEVPINQWPHHYIVPHLEIPSLISGVRPPGDQLGLTFHSESDEEGLRRLLAANNLRSLTATSGGLSPETMPRVLAKTAHAYASAELGVDGFTPVLLPIIHWAAPQPFHPYVGGLGPGAAQRHESLHGDVMTVNGTDYFAVTISMHSFRKFPPYLVLAGTIP